MAIVQKGLSLGLTAWFTRGLQIDFEIELSEPDYKKLRYLWSPPTKDPDLMKPVVVTKSRQCGK